MTEATGHAHSATIIKCPQARQLKTAEIYSLSVVKAKNPKQGVCRAALSLEALLGGAGICFWLSVALGLQSQRLHPTPSSHHPLCMSVSLCFSPITIHVSESGARTDNPK